MQMGEPSAAGFGWSCFPTGKACGPSRSPARRLSLLGESLSVSQPPGGEASGAPRRGRASRGVCRSGRGIVQCSSRGHFVAGFPGTSQGDLGLFCGRQGPTELCCPVGSCSFSRESIFNVENVFWPKPTDNMRVYIILINVIKEIKSLKTCFRMSWKCVRALCVQSR